MRQVVATRKAALMFALRGAHRQTITDEDPACGGSRPARSRPLPLPHEQNIALSCTRWSMVIAAHPIKGSGRGALCAQ